MQLCCFVFVVMRHTGYLSMPGEEGVRGRVHNGVVPRVRLVGGRRVGERRELGHCVDVKDVRVVCVP